VKSNEQRPGDTLASVTIIALGYRARCTEPGCRNLARLLLRYADSGGRPTINPHFCHAHAQGSRAIERWGSGSTTIARAQGMSGF
jgi:hypothetical protein